MSLEITIPGGRGLHLEGVVFDMNGTLTRDGRLILRGEGTSEMAKGMLTLLLDIFSDRTPDEILAFDPKTLHEMGVVELLSPVRQKSMEAFLAKVYDYAKRCKEGTL